MTLSLDPGGDPIGILRAFGGVTQIDVEGQVRGGEFGQISLIERAELVGTEHQACPDGPAVGSPIAADVAEVPPLGGACKQSSSSTSSL